ncbi:uncharacterized protein BKCO1_3100092 [Diplodia corticola]|uniref:Integral membrane protein n=1 Tax=Diplodia corticola TaxID=236234 RepID=A0A1J9QYC5_9PEZI|nr:uncharacterized protein BKCO1_3100092 [Diplodia corticola]OJD33400.1 integral membrane protein [Diplodia corticola]
MYSKACLSRSPKLEDWVLLSSHMLSITMTGVVGGEVSVALKMVGHKWEEEAENVSKLALLVLCSNLLYQILINATKASFLLQYLRLFQESWAQKLCKALLVVVFGAALYGFFGGIFMCRPVARYWNPLLPGTCRDPETYWVVTSSIGIAMDFVVWLLPMPLLRRLHLPLKQKLGLTAVFALGGFVCIVSVLRLSLVQMYAAAGNAEEGGISAIIWSAIEANVGIICASLMAMKPLLGKVFPWLVDTAGPSQGNMRLPTIPESPLGPSVWVQNWSWGTRHDAMCSASRPASSIPAPQEAHSILVTKQSVVEANWTRDDSVACISPTRPPKFQSGDFGE